MFLAAIFEVAGSPLTAMGDRAASAAERSMWRLAVKVAGLDPFCLTMKERVPRPFVSFWRVLWRVATGGGLLVVAAGGPGPVWPALLPCR